MKPYTTLVPDLRCELREAGLLSAAADVVFLAHNCALLERPVPSGVVYLAVNIHTQETRRLLTLQEPLHQSQYDMVARWLLAHPLQVSGGKEPPTVRERADKLLRRLLTECVPGVAPSYRSTGGAMLERFAAREGAVCATTTNALQVGILAAVVWSLLTREGPAPAVVSFDALVQRATLAYIPDLSRKLLEREVCRRPLIFALHKGAPERSCEAALRAYLSFTQTEDKLVELPPPDLLCALRSHAVGGAATDGTCALRAVCLRELPEVPMTTLVFLPERA